MDLPCRLHQAVEEWRGGPSGATMMVRRDLAIHAGRKKGDA
ncbi:MAG TPA: hypothetical protein VHG52_13640 [Thermomicrobiales bacterium]|nr:hypothetical protein [Thermomicrobiales bacterium]